MAGKEKKNTKPAKTQKVKKQNRILKYFRDLISETKKITWPTGKTVLNNTLVVIAAILVVGAFIWALDALLSLLLKLFLSL